MAAIEGTGAPIAIRGAKPGSSREPIRVQAQILRDWQAAEPLAAMSGFALVPPEPAAAAEPGRRAAWRKADLKRAISVAEETGLTSYRIEIAPDGTITIIVDGADG